METRYIFRGEASPVQAKKTRGQGWTRILSQFSLLDFSNPHREEPNMKKPHNPHSFANLLRLIGLTLLTLVVYCILKIQGKLRM